VGSSPSTDLVATVDSVTVAGFREAYSARAAEYIDLFGDIDAAAATDREQVLRWAVSVRGRIIDVGCGPGQWTSFLAGHGVDIEGVDPVPVFVREAQRRHPDVAFRVGNAQALDVESGSVGGVLAWFSLIHADPTELNAALDEFARSLGSRGGLAIGFLEGPSSNHSITPSRQRTSGRST